MQINRCINCMEMLGDSTICPYCGYDSAREPEIFGHLRPGTILRGRYLIGRALGQGGFGITYVGFDLRLEIKVAVKEAYFTWRGSQAGSGTVSAEQEAFLREGQKMAKLRDVQGLSHVLDVFCEQDTAYLVMDFAEGETLAARLKRLGRPMSWTEYQPILLETIKTMKMVHQRGLIHRDLSPDNLMLDPAGGVRILDLGAAKDLDKGGASSMVVAKNGFTPLEQYTQRGDSDPATDVYALAATSFYALTGNIPQAAPERVDEDRLDFSPLEARGVPNHVVQALRGAMALRKKDRLPSMEAFDAMLENNAATMAQSSVYTIPPTAPLPREKSASSTSRVLRHWIIGILAGVACMAILVLVIALPGQTSSHSTPGLTQSHEQKSALQSEQLPVQVPQPYEQQDHSEDGIWGSDTSLPERENPNSDSSADATTETSSVDATTDTSTADEPSEGFEYEENDDGSITITGYDKSLDLKQLVIPDELGGKPVTVIGNRAFSYTDLVTLTLPDGLIDIGDSAFYKCKSLKEVDIPDSVTRIGKRVFEDCTSLQTVALPDGITCIREGTFRGCSGLKSVQFPNALSSIEDSAFHGCFYLESVNFPDSLTSIGENAFHDCTSLVSLVIPDKVTNIVRWAFSGCSALESVSFPKELECIENWAFNSCVSLSEVSVPQNCQVGNAAFDRDVIVRFYD